MAAWKALLKKELRLGSLTFIVFMAFQLGLMGFGIFGVIRYGSFHKPDAMAVVGVLLITFHFFYLLSYLVVNAFLEKKTFHLWMHHPLPARSMLAAKLAGGFVYLTLSLMVAGLYTWITLKMYSQSVDLFHHIHVYRFAAIFAVSIYWIAIFSGIVIIFLWLVFRCLRSRVGKWAWLVMIAGVSAVIYALVKLSQLGWLSFLTHWGRIPDSFMRYWFSVFPRSGGLYTDYIGNYVAGLLVMALLYAGSSWLMDHKLEVS